MGLFSRKQKQPEDLVEKMMAAVAESDTGRIGDLIARGASPNPVGASVPLQEAVKRERAEVVIFLLEHGAKPDVQVGEDSTPLIAAAGQWRGKPLDALLAKGADPNFKAKNGETPLQKAQKKYESSNVRKLVEAGADVNVPEEDGTMPLHRAAMSYSSEETLRLFLPKVLDVNAQMPDGSTALHIAAKRGIAGVALLLLEKGADTSIVDKEGNTAADLADKSFPALAAVLRGVSPAVVAKSAENGNWLLVAPDEVARVTPKNILGYRITEVFNFSARTYTKISRNMESGAESQAIKSFSEIAEGGLVAAARAALSSLGGEAPGRFGLDKKKLQRPDNHAGI